MILLVYLNDRYGIGKKLEIPKLKNFTGYSTGGLYSALDDSGYFERKRDEITLTDKGERYDKKELTRQLTILYPLCYFLILFGIIMIGHWYLLTYHNTLLLFNWPVGFSLVLGGLLIRFVLPALGLWILKLRKKV